MSWSPEARSVYVEGFITGHYSGSREVCDLEDEKPQLYDQRQLAARGATRPSGICFQERSTYGKAGFCRSDLDRRLVDPVTSFYTAHEELRSLPFPKLLEQLSDQKNKSVDDLYAMALHGQLGRMDVYRRGARGKQ